VTEYIPDNNPLAEEPVDTEGDQVYVNGDDPARVLNAIAPLFPPLQVTLLCEIIERCGL
jgi:hypothetical protein